MYDFGFLADLIFPHSKHYQHLNLHVPLPCNFLSLAKPAVGMFGQLESLILVDLDDPGPCLFQYAPNLCKLSITMENYSPLLFTLPWGQLTHVIMVDFISTVMWSIILKQCINIQPGSFSLFWGCWAQISDLCLSWLSLIDLTIILNEHTGGTQHMACNVFASSANTEIVLSFSSGHQACTGVGCPFRQVWRTSVKDQKTSLALSEVMSLLLQLLCMSRAVTCTVDVSITCGSNT